MKVKMITTKEVSLNNNCPECFSMEGLKLTFKQKFIETKFLKSLAQDFSTQLNCNTCKTIIYPVNWTKDIDRVYEYQIKAFKPKKAFRKFKSLFWIIIGIVVALVTTTLVVLFVNLPESL